MGETYYDLLGVPEDASTEEIERAYREKLKETHPDVSDSADASDRTKRLIDAKETLTDASERARYDRLGHETYVGADETDPASQGTGTSDTAGTATERTAGQRRDRRGASRQGHTTGQDTGSAEGTTTSTENVGKGAAWAQTDKSSDARTGVGGTRNVWSADRAYAVNRGVDAFRFGGVFRNQRALVLLGSTFLVYPVLLFGALSQDFPLAINLLVAACVVFVIAFLQSVPEVGVVVFGVWTLLLPPVLFLGLSVSPLSLQAVLALTAVVFPLGLSALTRVAIRPMTAG